MVAVGTGQQEACLGVGGPDHNPPLGPAIVGERRRIVDKFESKDINEELDRRVVVVNDDGDQFQKRHRKSLPWRLSQAVWTSGTRHFFLAHVPADSGLLTPVPSPGFGRNKRGGGIDTLLHESCSENFLRQSELLCLRVEMVELESTGGLFPAKKPQVVLADGAHSESSIVGATR